MATELQEREAEAMKFTYHENPFCTEVELEGLEKTVMLQAIRADLIDDAIMHLNFSHEHNKTDTPQAMQEIRDLHKVTENGDFAVDDKAQAHFEWYARELLRKHDGGCIAVSHSCTKCTAEEFAEANTLEGLDKGAGCALYFAFEKHKTIDAVIAALSKSNNKDAPAAREWIFNYKKEKLKL